jgi:hypothetical protein
LPAGSPSPKPPVPKPTSTMLKSQVQDSTLFCPKVSEHSESTFVSSRSHLEPFSSHPIQMHPSHPQQVSRLQEWPLGCCWHVKRAKSRSQTQPALHVLRLSAIPCEFSDHTVSSRMSSGSGVGCFDPLALPVTPHTCQTLNPDTFQFKSIT